MGVKRDGALRAGTCHMGCLFDAAGGSKTGRDEECFLHILFRSWSPLITLLDKGEDKVGGTREDAPPVEFMRNSRCFHGIFAIFGGHLNVLPFNSKGR